MCTVVESKRNHLRGIPVAVLRLASGCDQNSASSGESKRKRASSAPCEFICFQNPTAPMLLLSIKSTPTDSILFYSPTDSLYLLHYYYMYCYCFCTLPLFIYAYLVPTNHLRFKI